MQPSLPHTWNLSHVWSLRRWYTWQNCSLGCVAIDKKTKHQRLVLLVQKVKHFTHGILPCVHACVHVCWYKITKVYRGLKSIAAYSTVVHDDRTAAANTLYRYMYRILDWRSEQLRSQTQTSRRCSMVSSCLIILPVHFVKNLLSCCGL